MLTKLERIGKVFEDTLLLIILGSMIGLAAMQILLRNFFDFGFIWTDELLRMLVLWLAVAGAIAASRRDRHISIAILDRYVPESISRWVEILIDAFTALICGLVAWHSARFVYSAWEFGDTMMGNFPAWILQAVVPFGFTLISWRYLVFITRGIRGKPRVEPAP